MRRVLITMMFLVLIIPIATAQEGWMAYNDCVFEAAQFIADNVTTFAIGRGNPNPESGNLVRVSNGQDTGVTVTFTEFKTVGSLNWATDAALFDNGSDAAEIFGDFVDPTGNISYGDAPGWYLDLSIEGLDADGLYTFVGSVNRGGDGDYGDRVTNWKLMQADSFTYASSDGAHKVAEDSVEFATGINGDGLIARWTNISSGEDGTIVIRTSHGVGKADGGLPGAHESKGYAGGVFMLEYQGPRAVTLGQKLTTTWAGLRIK